MRRSDQNRYKTLTFLRRTPVLIACSCLVVTSVFFTGHNFGTSAATCSSASDCQRQIDKLNAANAKAKSSLNSLVATASSYQDAINKLQAQISKLQAQIDDNLAQQAKVQKEIDAEQKEMDRQKAILADDIKTTYLNGQITPVEMLATSSNLSEYIDKQEAYSKVQDAIQTTMDKIAALQKQLQVQKAKVDQLLAEEKDQNQLLQDSKAKQLSLLDYNQSQQAAFNRQISANKAAINSLMQQQFLYNVQTYGAASYGGTGGYPYYYAHQVSGTYNWEINGSVFDPAGWAYRNCTSYAFWRLNQARHIYLPWSDFPTVYNSGGKIGYSIPDFRSLGYTVDHNPEGAMLAVNGAGPYGGGTYGHIMYVEASTSSNAYVSQYNYAGDGNYSTMTIYPSWQTWFVHP